MYHMSWLVYRFTLQYHLFNILRSHAKTMSYGAILNVKFCFGLLLRLLNLPSTIEQITNKSFSK